MEDKLDKNVARQVRALLAKARGTENEHEAMIFLAKATEILQRHNKTEADLGGDDATEPMVKRLVKSKDWNPWRKGIINALAQLYFSDTFYDNYIDDYKIRRGVVLVGRPHNLDVIESMFDYLVKTVLRLAKEYSRDRGTILRFEKGCGLRIAQRLWLMSAEARRPKPQLENQGGTTLPALYKTELELASAIVDQETGGRLARRSHHRKYGDAGKAGFAAGDKVNLGGQIGTAKTSHLLGSR